MSDEEKQPQVSKTPKEEPQDQQNNKVVDDARSRALAEALQSSFKIVRIFMVILGVAFMCSGITKVNENEQALYFVSVYTKTPH